MSRRFVDLLEDGETINEVFLLTDRQLRANRNGDMYLLTQMQDRTGSVSGLLWNVNETTVAHINAGDYVRAKGKAQLFQGNLQVILNKLEVVELSSIDTDDFIPQPKAETGAHLLRLKEILFGLKDENLKALAEAFFSDAEITDGLTRAPAGIRLHHAFHGGLLEHILNLSETALRIEDLYPNINFELLLMGIFLHDLGKLWELSYDTSFAYTDEGQLIGHLVIGVEVLNKKILLAEQITGRVFPSETALRLKHMIVSHHGSYEFGSPKLPMTPEAIALHLLDNLDAKTNEFHALIDSDLNSSSNWTPYQNTMQRKLFKGGNE